ncbi:MAG: amidinotransferase [Gemmatimonadota bacterium]|nr:MAG: amidinotransferase [Gemmatimonadota bacterium]
MLRNDGDRLRRVLVSSPGSAYFDPTTHAANNIPELADRTQTGRQHARMVATLTAAGAEVIDVPGLEGHPNSVFTRDVALCTPNGHIVLRMGLAARRGEERWMSAALEELGEPCIGAIEDPGTVEGGDVILAGTVAFVGISGRTNGEGARQLADMLEGMGYEVRTIMVAEQHLHLGGAMSVIAPKRLLCCDTGVPADVLEGFDVVTVQGRGPSTGNVICVGPNEVIANIAENAEAIRILERNGVIVHSVDLSEFRKGAGGPTCLILPVERGE